jgi:hypothetical protein
MRIGIGLSLVRVGALGRAFSPITSIVTEILTRSSATILTRAGATVTVRN